MNEISEYFKNSMFFNLRSKQIHLHVLSQEFVDSLGLGGSCKKFVNGRSTKERQENC